MSNEPQWLLELGDEYPTKRTPKALARMMRAFSHVDDETMRRAVDLYMLDGNEFFPKVSSLVKYVKMAKEEARGEDTLKLHPTVQYSDDEIHAWELARGGYGKETDGLDHHKEVTSPW